MEMAIRALIILLFSTSAIILLYAYVKRPFTYHLLGVIIWCVHVILFTSVAILCIECILEITPKSLNVWSNVVRLHGGIVVFTTGLYYLDKRGLL